MMVERRELTSALPLWVIGIRCSIPRPCLKGSALFLIYWTLVLFTTVSSLEGVMHTTWLTGLVRDLNEELSVQDAKTAHEHLKPALDPQDNRKWDPNSPQMKFKMLLSECVVECIKIDRELGISMLKAFHVLWLDVAENASSEEPQTLDNYWRVRRSNGGLR